MQASALERAPGFRRQAQVRDIDLQLLLGHLMPRPGANCLFCKSTIHRSLGPQVQNAAPTEDSFVRISGAQKTCHPNGYQRRSFYIGTGTM
jgi:hypothetical protein